METFEDKVKFHLDGLKENLENDCLDPELYDLLIDLNQRGFFTSMSCAGHTRGTMAHGWITFSGPRIFRGAERESLFWLLQVHGLTDITLEVRKDGHTIATFAPIGSQYDRLTDEHPEDQDFCFDVPPRPERCETCGKTEFWLHGDPYDIEDTLEWMCKECQPKPFDSDFTCLTPEIAKRLEELPSLKLWEVEDGETGKTFPMRAKNQLNIYRRLGLHPYNDNLSVFIKRVK